MQLRSQAIMALLIGFLFPLSCTVTLDKLQENPSPSKPCVPKCANKECGDDGCGGICGGCNSNAPYCSATGKCVSQCTPSCTNKECGSDGCGGKCGQPCGLDSFCMPQGQCQKKQLYTKGNHIYMADGKLFQGRGANIFDARSCYACVSSPDTREAKMGEAKRRIDELVDVWKANFLRLILSSDKGNSNTASVLDDNNYLADIREIVHHIGTKSGVFVLVTVHEDPSIDGYGLPTIDLERGTDAVWRKLISALYDQPHAMLGIINEPHGSDDSTVWNRMNELVKAIRRAESEAGCPEHIIAVQGTQLWARTLDYYVQNPITAGNGNNIVYETHAYGYEYENYIAPAAKIPVIIGEFGPYKSSDNDYMTLEHCKKLMIKAEEMNIPYLAWEFHMRCGDDSLDLLKDYSNGGCGIDMRLEPTEWGQVLKDRLAKPWGSP